LAVGLSVSEANAILTTFIASPLWLQLHTGDPGPNGTANIAGNATRKQPTLATPAGGATSNTAVVPWSAGEVDTTESYSHWSGWSAASGGTFRCSGLASGNVTAGDAYQIPIGALDLALTVAS
jgi:hypothetical protein